MQFQANIHALCIVCVLKKCLITRDLRARVFVIGKNVKSFVCILPCVEQRSSNIYFSALHLTYLWSIHALKELLEPSKSSANYTFEIASNVMMITRRYLTKKS